MTQPFDAIADAYDAWYDASHGRAIFQTELACLHNVAGELCGRWLEVGVGSGRFAAEMGIPEGIDPSLAMLEKAASRGIQTHQGNAEALPFPDETFDGAFMALTLCFVDNAAQALKECFRVVRPQGSLLLGVVPADSPWGEDYRRKAAEAHPVYRHASFRMTSEIVTLAEGAGFRFRNAASTLLWKPTGPPETEPRVQPGLVAEAGFIALLFEKPTA